MMMMIYYITWNTTTLEPLSLRVSPTQTVGALCALKFPPNNDRLGCHATSWTLTSRAILFIFLRAPLLLLDLHVSYQPRHLDDMSGRGDPAPWPSALSSYVWTPDPDVTMSMWQCRVLRQLQSHSKFGIGQSSEGSGNHHCLRPVVDSICPFASRQWWLSNVQVNAPGWSFTGQGQRLSSCPEEFIAGGKIIPVNTYIVF